MINITIDELAERMLEIVKQMPYAKEKLDIILKKSEIRRIEFCC